MAMRSSSAFFFFASAFSFSASRQACTSALMRASTGASMSVIDFAFASLAFISARADSLKPRRMSLMRTRIATSWRAPSLAAFWPASVVKSSTAFS
ncbi:hypothetical protein D3C87_1873770 [compost metagenome]